MYCKRVKFFYPLVVTSFEDSVHELFCFHMYRPVQSREREEGQVCIVASVYGMIDCYCTLRFRYEPINLDAMCCISVLLSFKSLFSILKELGSKGLRNNISTWCCAITHTSLLS